MSATRSANHRRIAIVAVHGVGDQAPNETVRSIASLLQRVDAAPEGDVHYSSFGEDSLRLRIDPLASQQKQQARPKATRAYFTSQFAAEANRAEANAPAEAARTDAPPAPREAPDRSAQFIAH